MAEAVLRLVCEEHEGKFHIFGQYIPPAYGHCPHHKFKK